MGNHIHFIMLEIVFAHVCNIHTSVGTSTVLYLYTCHNLSNKVFTIHTFDICNQNYQIYKLIIIGFEFFVITTQMIDHVGYG